MMPRVAKPSRKLILLATYVFAAHSSGEFATADLQSIELTVDSTPLVVRGMVVSAEVYGQPRGDIDQTRVVVHIEEVLKGNPPDPLVFAAYEMTEDAPIRQRDVGHEMLFFLQPSQLGTAERRDCVGCTTELATAPAGSSGLQFIDLTGQRSLGVWNNDLVKTSDPQKILKAARDAATTNQKITPFGVVLLDGEHLWICDDGRLTKRAEEWSRSDDPIKRFAAVDIFASLGPDRGTPQLRRLLSDNYLEPELHRDGVNPWTHRLYTIRLRAWNVLRYWTDIGKPVEGVDPRIYRPIPLKTIALVLMGSIIVLSIWISRRFSKQLGRPRTTIWRCSLCIGGLLSVAIGLSFLYSLDVVDGRRGLIRNLTLVRGRVQFRSFHFPAEIDIEPKRVWATFRLGANPSPQNGYAAPSTFTSRNFAGFSFGAGSGVAPTEIFYLVPSLYLAIPIWPLATLSILPAAAVLARRRQIAHRVAAGRCPQCGYDLRATVIRCPECGWSKQEDFPSCANAKLPVIRSSQR